jgi:AraC-like DNA-binding protein
MEKDKNLAKGISLPDYGLLIESHRHESDFATDTHSHEYPSLMYIISGQGKCLIKKNEYELKTNTALLLRKGQKHQLIDKPKKAMVVFVIYFSERITEIKRNLIEPLANKNIVKVPIQYARRIRTFLRQMLYEQNNRPEHYKLALQQLLLYIIINLNRATVFEKKQAKKLTSSNSLERVNAVLDYIKIHYYERNSLPDVAKAASLSQRQFSNLCKKTTGRSYIQFLNSLRIKRAEELIKKTDMPVSDIAFEVGFEELSTFYRAYKKHQGANPLKQRG